MPYRADTHEGPAIARPTRGAEAGGARQGHGLAGISLANPQARPPRSWMAPGGRQLPLRGARGGNRCVGGGLAALRAMPAPAHRAGLHGSTAPMPGPSWSTTPPARCPASPRHTASHCRPSGKRAPRGPSRLRDGVPGSHPADAGVGAHTKLTQPFRALACRTACPSLRAQRSHAVGAMLAEVVRP